MVDCHSNSTFLLFLSFLTTSIIHTYLKNLSTFNLTFTHSHGNIRSNLDMYLSQHVEKPRARTPNLLSISWGEIIRLKHILCRSHRSRQTQTFLTAHSHFHNLISASFSTTQIIFHLDFQSGNGNSWGSLLS